MMMRSGKLVGSADEEKGYDRNLNEDLRSANMAVSSSSRENQSQSLSNAHDDGNKSISNHSKAPSSCASSTRVIRRRILEAQCKANEDIMRIENEKYEREKRMILNKLELQQAIIEEENEIESSSGFENSDENIRVEQTMPSGNDKVSSWVQSIEPESSEANSTVCMTDCLVALKDAIVSMSRQGNNPEVNKLMSRQAVGKQLPTFSGTPEEWPAFINTFRSSSVICGYTSEENMLRLQQCLKGKARESVQSMLYLSNNVEDVVRTLELRFGRPNCIIKGIISKAKQMSCVRDDKPDSLIEFSTTIRNLVAAMQSLDRVGHMMNPQLLEELVFKLPHRSRLDWGREIQRLKLAEPTLKEFSGWLDTEAAAASEICSGQYVPERFEQTRKFEDKWKAPKSFNVLTTVRGGDTKACKFCMKPGHSVGDCYAFKRATISERLKWATANKTCFSCLGNGHYGSQCPQKRKCSHCEKFHHTLLHHDDHVETVAHASTHPDKVLLRVLPVTITGPKSEIQTYALFDEASTVTLMDSKLAEQVGLDGPNDPLTLRWTNDSMQHENSSRRINVDIRGTDGSYQMENVRTVKNLNLPVQTVNVKKLKDTWSHLRAVEIDPMIGAQPKILIGQDNCHLIIARQVIEGPQNAPVLSRTKLGWVVHGNIKGFRSLKREELNFHLWSTNPEDDELHNLVKDSFKTESFGVALPSTKFISSEDARAKIILESTTKRVGQRWETGLLWRKDDDFLPDSKPMALQRLRSVERTLQRDPNFSEAYRKKIAEYVEKGYAAILSPDKLNCNSKQWFLPHFGVHNANKPGKMRFVFDAAAKTKGISLNDRLMAGPDLLKSLVSVLFKFRQQKIGFMGDIKEMFHQVVIREEDLPFQRFLWRDMDTNRDPDIYQMCVMTFGSTSSPCSAQYVKNRNAYEFMNEFPEAVKAITERHYVDDYLDSVHDEKEAIKLIAEVIELHRRGGFEIRNFSCSSKEVLKSIPIHLRASNDEEIVLKNKDLPIERVLGLKWNPNQDVFSFALNFHRVPTQVVNCTKIPTKREVLKLVMSLYDPVGFIVNYTVAGKILIQDIWRSGIGWDDEISCSSHEKWKVWMSALPSVSNVKIPRCYSSEMAMKDCVDLHTFCDASEKAFAAVSYLRIVSNSKVTIAFVMARSRVAPLRPISIPRLELQAAVMGTRLSKSIKDEHEITINQSYYWTDSRTVLCWLRSDARNFKQFVGHRIGEIFEESDASQWRWVPTLDNPADDATRENTPELSSHSRWILGPQFLYLNENEWPKESKMQPVKDDLEMKSDVVLLCSTANVLPDPSRFSCWLKLIRTTAWIFRFKEKMKSKIRKEKHFWPRSLTVQELSEAEKHWWRQLQKDCYHNEIQQIKLGRKLVKSSSLNQLCPWLDPENILRVKGRIPQSNAVNENLRNPVILHQNHPFTRLLIRHFHIKANHNGMEFVTNEVRQQYWVPNLRMAVRREWSNCQFCKNRRASPHTPQMGEIPLSRMNINTRPFTATGMDYFGPLEVSIGRKREKRYGVIFTCLTTRAVHLELAGSLSTDSCILALRRMFARRGQPSVIYSDNGTNLRGAEKVLRELLTTVNSEVIEETLANRGIKWKFSPPGTPHMGGIWERLIRSVKTAIRVTLKERAPKEEVLYTLLLEAESILNSRPLTFVSLDHMDDEALTPNHFLLGGSSGTTTLTTNDVDDPNLRKQWNQAQKLTDQFWARWVKEYLPVLTRRTKWFQPTTPIELQSVVIIADPTLPRNFWPKGIVTKLYPGRDRQVRVVDVKTSWGTMRKPVCKLCVLDIKSDGDGSADPTPEGSMLSSCEK